MQPHFDNICSKYQCGFLKGYHLQPCLVTMIEKWCESVNKGGAFGALLIDIPKAIY